jgi:hypothetical protein
MANPKDERAGIAAVFLSGSCREDGPRLLVLAVNGHLSMHAVVLSGAMSSLSEVSGWLTAHSTAVQAAAAAFGTILAAVLVCVTIVYARTTSRILEESRKSREAAEKQAAAAQETLALLKSEYEERLGLGPQRVREAVLNTKLLLVYWSEQATRAFSSTDAIPDPEALVKTDLPGVMDFARMISTQCVDLISQTIGALRNAKGEFEKIQHAPLVFGRIRRTPVPGPQPYLQQADGLLNQLIALLSNKPEGDAAAAKPNQ